MNDIVGDPLVDGEYKRQWYFLRRPDLKTKPLLF